MLIDMIQQSLTNVKVYIYQLFAVAIMPADCKIAMHQFKAAMHALLASITGQGSALLWYMDKTYSLHPRNRPTLCSLHHTQHQDSGKHHFHAIHALWHRSLE